MLAPPSRLSDTPGLLRRRAALCDHRFGIETPRGVRSRSDRDAVRRHRSPRVAHGGNRDAVLQARLSCSPCRRLSCPLVRRAWTFRSTRRGVPRAACWSAGAGGRAREPRSYQCCGDVVQRGAPTLRVAWTACGDSARLSSWTRSATTTTVGARAHASLDRRSAPYRSPPDQKNWAAARASNNWVLSARRRRGTRYKHARGDSGPGPRGARRILDPSAQRLSGTNHSRVWLAARQGAAPLRPDSRSLSRGVGARRSRELDGEAGWLRAPFAPHALPRHRAAPGQNRHLLRHAARASTWSAADARPCSTC